MLLAARVAAALVAVLHLAFFWMESFAWRRYARPAFGVPEEHVETLAPAMSNQGFYNAILAAALLMGALWYQPGLAWSYRVFFLSAAALAGLWGAATVNPRIFLVQSVPSLVALALTLLAGKGLP